MRQYICSYQYPKIKYLFNCTQIVTLFPYVSYLYHLIYKFNFILIAYIIFSYSVNVKLNSVVKEGESQLERKQIVRNVFRKDHLEASLWMQYPPSPTWTTSQSTTACTIIIIIATFKSRRAGSQYIINVHIFVTEEVRLLGVELGKLEQYGQRNRNRWTPTPSRPTIIVSPLNLN